MPTFDKNDIFGFNLSTIRAEDTDVAVDVMINQYTNKELAVVRELLTNALDAQTQAGVSTPVNVILPTFEHPELIITDHGIGMSEHDISEVFTRPAASTKRESRTVTGRIGIGAKSPFILTDRFAVTSIKDGKQTSATLARIEGTLTHRIDETRETTKPNGTVITVPIPFEDEEEDPLRFYSRVAPALYTVSRKVAHVCFNGIEPGRQTRDFLRWDDFINEDYSVKTPEGYEIHCDLELPLNQMINKLQREFPLLTELIKPNIPNQRGWGFQKQFVIQGHNLYTVDNLLDAQFRTEDVNYHPFSHSATTVIIVPPLTYEVSRTRESVIENEDNKETHKKVMRSLTEGLKTTTLARFEEMLSFVDIIEYNQDPYMGGRPTFVDDNDYRVESTVIFSPEKRGDQMITKSYDIHEKTDPFVFAAFKEGSITGQSMFMRTNPTYVKYAQAQMCNEVPYRFINTDHFNAKQRKILARYAEDHDLEFYGVSRSFLNEAKVAIDLMNYTPLIGFGGHRKVLPFLTKEQVDSLPWFDASVINPKITNSQKTVTDDLHAHLKCWGLCVTNEGHFVKTTQRPNGTDISELPPLIPSGTKIGALHSIKRRRLHSEAYTYKDEIPTLTIQQLKDWFDLYPKARLVVVDKGYYEGLTSSDMYISRWSIQSSFDIMAVSNARYLSRLLKHLDEARVIHISSLEEGMKYQKKVLGGLVGDVNNRKLLNYTMLCGPRMTNPYTSFTHSGLKWAIEDAKDKWTDPDVVAVIKQMIPDREHNLIVTGPYVENLERTIEGFSPLIADHPELQIVFSRKFFDTIEAHARAERNDTEVPPHTPSMALLEQTLKKVIVN